MGIPSLSTFIRALLAVELVSFLRLATAGRLVHASFDCGNATFCALQACASDLFANPEATWGERARTAMCKAVVDSIRTQFRIALFSLAEALGPLPAGAPRRRFFVVIDGNARYHLERLDAFVAALRAFWDKRAQGAPVAAQRLAQRFSFLPEDVRDLVAATLRREISTLAAAGYLPDGWDVSVIVAPSDADSAMRALYSTAREVGKEALFLCFFLFVFSIYLFF